LARLVGVVRVALLRRALAGATSSAVGSTVTGFGLPAPTTW
jgi:hypothetical protein